MSGKSYRSRQDRYGSPARRALEFDVLRDQMTRNRERFVRRLKRLVSRNSFGPLHCVRLNCTRDRNGYPRMNFRHPEHGHVTICGNRLFTMLREGRAIPRGYEAAHLDGCTDRRCVRHVGSLPYQVNARTNGDHAGIPF